MEKEIELLDLINNNKNLSQRDLSKLLNISLGKVNNLINYFEEQEVITINKVNRHTEYRLTEKGISILEDILKQNSNKRIKLHEDGFKKVKQAVILAAGERSGFGKPVGTLEIEETTIIERTLDILKENGIEKIVIVLGYASEYYDEIVKKRNLLVVKNDRYKWTGTMASLAAASEYLDDDFILVESDVIYEERAISDMLNNPNRDCILVTSETGSGDEAFVEIRDERVVKISKDIHMFNKIDGEMVGIIKLSYEVYKKMLKDFEGNKNPYLNYEYSLLDIGKNYKIGYTKIDDLVWYEVDNIRHYKKVINRIYSLIKRREIEIKSNIIKGYLKDVLNLEEKQIGSITSAGGMTNKNYKIYIDEKPYVLRIPGNGTEEMINRKYEKINANLAVSLGLDKNILYMNDETGIKVAEFIKNAETLNSTTAKREDNMKLVSNLLKRLHNSNITMENIFNPFDLMLYYEELALKYKGKFYHDYHVIKDKVFKLKDKFYSLNKKLYPCHNDTLPDNFVKDSDGNMYLIDWEYSGLNDPMWDVAAHMLEAGFNNDEEELFLDIYFNGKLTKELEERILLNKICQDFLWALWTILKEARGDDFGTYGIDRYERAINNLSRFYKE